MGWIFNQDSFLALKSELERNAIEPQKIHNLCSHLNQIFNGCANIVYWKNRESTVEGDKKIYSRNQYINDESWIKSILRNNYGCEHYYDMMVQNIIEGEDKVILIE
jgi:hypothetical protein